MGRDLSVLVNTAGSREKLRKPEENLLFFLGNICKKEIVSVSYRCDGVFVWNLPGI